MSDIKNKQHYVFQAYLNKWCNEKNQVYVLKKNEKKLFCTTTNNILHLRQMYKIQELNNDEKNFIEILMTVLHFNNADKHEMRKHIGEYLTPYNNQKIVEALKKWNPIPEGHPFYEDINKEFEKLDELINIQVVNTEEDFLSEYEGDGMTWINKIIAGDTNFYYPENTKIKILFQKEDFLNFICVQYFRTLGMRNQIINNIKEMLNIYLEYDDSLLNKSLVKYNFNNIQPKNILPHFIWMVQAKCSAGLSNANIMIVRNRTDLPFITSDQPVMNMKTKVNGEETKEFVLWYPLSPEVGIIINDERGERNLYNKLDVDKFNCIVWKHSFEYIISNKEELLRGMLDMEW